MPGQSTPRRLLGLSPKALFKGLIMIVTLVAVGYLLRVAEVDKMLDEAWLDAQVKGRGVYGVGVFILIGALVSGLGAPRQLVCFAGGYAFGFVLGGVWALVGQSLGCALAFFYARFMGRPLVRRRYGERVQRIDDFLHDNTFSMTLLVRLLPVGSNLLTNLAAGVSGVRALPFFAGSVVGYAPQTIVFALVGDGVNDAQNASIVISVALFVISTALGAYLYRRYRHGKSLGGEAEDEV